MKQIQWNNMDWLKEFCIGLSFIVKFDWAKVSDFWYVVRGQFVVHGCSDCWRARLAIELVKEACCSHLHPSRRVDLIGGMSRWLLSQRYREGWSQLCSMSRQCHEMHWPCSDYGSSPEVHEILPTTQVPKVNLPLNSGIPSNWRCRTLIIKVIQSVGCHPQRSAPFYPLRNARTGSTLRLMAHVQIIAPKAGSWSFSTDFALNFGGCTGGFKWRLQQVSPSQC